MSNQTLKKSEATSTQCDRVVAIGTSAGGMKALQVLLAKLPKTFPWPIVLVQHLHPDSKTHLPGILSRSSELSIKLAEAGDRLQLGYVYVAPPKHHLTLTADYTLALNDDPRVHFSRPSIDILFQSVAEVCGAGAIAIVLTGSNSDGSDGMRAIKDHGGLTIVQSAESAESPRMPEAAIRTGAIDYKLDLAAIADKLIELSQNE